MNKLSHLILTNSYKVLRALLTASVVLFAAVQSKSRTRIKEKVYIAETDAACAEENIGGFTLYSYCLLQFSGDSVVVTEYSSRKRNLETPSELALMAPQQYSFHWHKTEGIILIDGFDKYGILRQEGKDLVGIKHSGTEVTFRLRR